MITSAKPAGKGGIMRQILAFSVVLVAVAAVTGCTLIIADGSPRPVAAARQPRFEIIAGTNISYDVSSNQDIFLLDGLYYRAIGTTWYACNDLGESWTRIYAVPPAFLMIPPGHSRYRVVRRHPSFATPSAPQPAAARPTHPTRPVRPATPGGPRHVVVPAGRPSFTAIPGTRVHYATGVNGHIFKCGGSYYRLVGRTWYARKKWTDAWRATTSVPTTFLNIPGNHPKYAVVPLHPNYRQLRSRYRPSIAPNPDRNRDDGRRRGGPSTPGRSGDAPGRTTTPPKPTFTPAAPRMVAIAGTGISYQVGTGQDVFLCGGRYYRCKGGKWFVRARWTDGWTPTSSVPGAFLKIPKGHAKHGVVKHHPKKKRRK